MSRRNFGVVRIAAVVLAAVAAASGCESEPAAESAVAQAAARTASQAAAQREEMVAAVTSSKTTGLVDLRFSLSQRPIVGEPVSIELALTPTVGLERLFARIQAAEGLELVNGGETPHIENPVAGTPVTHTVTVLPKSDGIFYITAVVLADSAKESVSRTFTIPIIAGQGVATAPEAPAAASTGEPQSMATGQ